MQRYIHGWRDSYANLLPRYILVLMDGCHVGLKLVSEPASGIRVVCVENVEFLKKMVQTRRADNSSNETYVKHKS